MKHFKDKNGQLYAFESDGSQDKFIEKTMVPISTEEHKILSRPKETWDSIRIKRNEKLSKSDWTVLPDSPLSVEDLEAWKDYRQALRNLPNSSENPDDIVWPTEPI